MTFEGCNVPGLLEPEANYADLKSQIRVGPGAHSSAAGAAIEVGRAAGWRRLVFICAGITPYLPVKSPVSGTADTTATLARCDSVKTNMAGVLFKTHWGGYSITDNLILGFDKVNVGGHFGRSQFRVERNMWDCRNGWLFDSMLDIAWITDNEGWPFLTANISSVDYTQNYQVLNRGDYAYKFNYRADGVQFHRNIGFGWKYSVDVMDCEGLRLGLYWGDWAALVANQSAEVGIRLRGKIDNIEVHAFNSVIFKTTIEIDGRAQAGGANIAQAVGRPVRFIAGNFSWQDYGSRLLGGSVVFDGACFESGALTGSHIYVADAVEQVDVVNCAFRNGGQVFEFATAGAASRTFWNNVYVAGVAEPTRLNKFRKTVQAYGGTNAGIIAEDSSSPAGAGPHFTLRGDLGGGPIDFGKIESRVVAGVGNEAVGMRFYTRRLTELRPAIDIDHERNVVPVTDNVSDLGTGSQRYKNLYLANNPTVSSDQRLKTDPLPIPDAILDAWGEVSPVTFQYLAAVAEKGAGNARIHFGYIAQHVVEAFERHGVDPFRYGIVGWDAEARAIEKTVAERVPRMEQVAVVAPPLPPEMQAAASTKASPPTIELREVRDDAGNVVFDMVDRVIVEHEETGETVLNLRYDQCAVLEAAYQRRRADRLETRVAALEAR